MRTFKSLIITTIFIMIFSVTTFADIEDFETEEKFDESYSELTLTYIQEKDGTMKYLEISGKPDSDAFASDRLPGVLNTGDYEYDITENGETIYCEDGQPLADPPESGDGSYYEGMIGIRYALHLIDTDEKTTSDERICTYVYELVPMYIDTEDIVTYACIDSQAKTLSIFQAADGDFKNRQKDDVRTYYTNVDKLSNRRGARWQDNSSLEKIETVIIENKFAPKDAYNMFFNMNSLKKIKGLELFDTSKTKDMSYMFALCESLPALDLSNFDTSNVRDMTHMFSGCILLSSLDLSSFDTSNVRSMTGMFYGCKSLLKVNLSGFNTSKTRSLDFMFSGCEKLMKIDLSSFDITKAVDMSSMFSDAYNLKTVIVSPEWELNKKCVSKDMFRDCRSITGENKKRYKDKHTDGEYARIDKKGSPGYLTATPVNKGDTTKTGTVNCPAMQPLFPVPEIVC